MQAFWLRQFLRSWAAFFEQLPEVEESWPDYFDNTQGIGPIARPLFYKHKGTGTLLPFKGTPRVVPVENRIGVCAHITAVAFGTTSRKRAWWKARIDDGTIDEPTWKLYGETPEKAAARMALHQRFWAVPYHWVGLLNGDILRNNDITRYTYHGNGANAHHIGVAAEAKLPGLEKNRKPGKGYHDLSAHNIETWRGALRLAVKDGRDRGAPVEELTAHRRYSKGRIGDPGEGWWKEVGLVIAKEMNLTIVYTTGNKLGGYDMCREWDPNGLVDYLGRPI